MEWSQYQTAVFDAVTDTEDHLVVLARAGSGKTSTIVEATNHLPPGSVLLCAFNKGIQQELESRVTDPAVKVKTLHSIGLWAHRMNERAVEVNPHKGRDIAQRVVELPEFAKLVEGVDREGQLDPRGNLYEATTRTQKLAALAKNTLTSTVEALRDLAYHHGYADKEFPGQLLALAARQCLVRAADQPEVVDYDDMLWLPYQFDHKRFPVFDVILVDEAQDLNALQIWLVKRMVGQGRVIAVGDTMQCHPPGVTVRTDHGEVPVEALDPTVHRIVPWQRKAQRITGQRGFQITSRPYNGELLRIQAGGASVETTPNHRFLVRWADRHTKVCVVYLMWRQGFGFRVGWCQLFRSGGCVNIIHRIRMEKASKAWVLKTFSDRTDASVYESQVAAKYGIPTATFEPVHGANHLTTAALSKIYGAISESSYWVRGLNILHEHKLYMDFPFYPTIITKGRNTFFECYAANLIPELMKLPSANEGCSWVPIESITMRPYQGEVYSLNVDKDKSYVADGVVTLNSMYRFRGADEHAIMRLFGGLSSPVALSLPITYRCATRIVDYVRPLVPDFQAREGAPEGLIETLPYEDAVKEFTRGDFVLSRTNAPLLRACLDTLKRGIPATIAGRDIGKQLAGLIRKSKAKTLGQLARYLQGYLADERESAAEYPDRYARAVDRVEAIRAIAGACQTPREMIQKIEILFSDQDSSSVVTCSTVHKAKGLERDRVFMLRETFGHYVRKPWHNEREEANIWYVACTRARETLCLVDGP